MALIEMKTCPHCGRHAWQEFVPKAAPACSFWRCRECGNRREARRLCLDQSALLPRSRIQTEHLCTDVLLVDIGRMGARLRCPEGRPIPLHPDERVLFNPHLQPFGELSRYTAAIVRWIRSPDFGVRFAHPLSASSSEIMRIVKN